MSPDTKAIRSAREKAGKTQREVAEALNVCERTVMRWELGQSMPPGDSLIRLARILRRNPEDLVRVA